MCEEEKSLRLLQIAQRILFEYFRIILNVVEKSKLQAAFEKRLN